MKTVDGALDGSGLHIGIAAARWNQAITDRLLDGAVTRLGEMGAEEITVLRVPGALELPLACKQLAEVGCDAVIAIGAVVKGETDHYDTVVRESARGLTVAALETGVPITNAILAVHDYQHAVDRAGVGQDNKGVEGVDAAITMATALRELRSS